MLFSTDPNPRNLHSKVIQIWNIIFVANLLKAHYPFFEKFHSMSDRVNYLKQFYEFLSLLNSTMVLSKLSRKNIVISFEKHQKSIINLPT